MPFGRRLLVNPWNIGRSVCAVARLLQVRCDFRAVVCVCIRLYTVVCLSSNCRSSCNQLVAWPYFFLRFVVYLPRETHFYDHSFKKKERDEKS